MNLDQLPAGLRTLHAFIKNAIIADAIGMVELKNLPPDIDALVSLGVEQWEGGHDSLLDNMVLLIILKLGLDMKSDQTAQ